MITVVCLSPSLDQTIALSTLSVGGTNRALESSTVPGGKGVNVALTLRRMGRRVTLIVYRHAQGAQTLFEALDKAGDEAEAIPVPGELRVNLKLMDKSSGVVTEVNAAAPAVPDDAQLAMEEAVAKASMESEWLILTGSLPRGCAPDAYARMIARVKKQAPTCRIALDAEGEALSLGIQEKPDFVKPNRHELELYAGEPLATREAICEAAAGLVKDGVETVLVSMDKSGCVLAHGQTALFAGALDVSVATTVGAGDAMLSGYICACAQGREEALRYAVAAAAARVAGQEGLEKDYLPQVQIALIGG